MTIDRVPFAAQWEVSIARFVVYLACGWNTSPTLGARQMIPVFALSTAATALLGVGVVVVLFVLYAIGTFNTLVALRNRYKNAFSQIDVQLKRRYDLIPNLVEVAKGYMGHERQTLEAVIHARNQAVTAQQKAASSPGDPAAMTSLGAAEGQVAGALGRLFALAESYPDLKANHEHARLARRVDVDREQSGVCPAILQRLGDELQHAGRAVSRLDHRGNGRLRAGAALRAGIAQGTRGSASRILIGCSAVWRGRRHRVRSRARFSERPVRMDFFQSQELARKKTGRLIVYFLLAVILIIVTVYVAIAAVLQLADPAARDGAT